MSNWTADLDCAPVLSLIHGQCFFKGILCTRPGHISLSAGVCASLLKANLHMPILGVCMGMQALAVAHGASVQHAPEPIHGRLSHIHHTHHELFQDIPSGVFAFCAANPLQCGQFSSQC